MAYERITWVPDVLRRAGLTVVEHDGWKRRGLSESRPFTPRAVVIHHDASAKGDSPGVPDYMIRNFSTSAAQLWVSRAGAWHIIASGRAPHAGTVLPGMPDNETSIGVETDHTTGEDWPDALLWSLRLGTASILAVLGGGAEALHFHKTICSPPGRKVDPAGLDLADERRRVARLINPEDDVPLTEADHKAIAQATWAEIKSHEAWFRNNNRVPTEAELLEQRPELVEEVVSAVLARLPLGQVVDSTDITRAVLDGLAARLQQ